MTTKTLNHLCSQISTRSKSERAALARELTRMLWRSEPWYKHRFTQHSLGETNLLRSLWHRHLVLA